jgi:hypothetical protein
MEVSLDAFPQSAISGVAVAGFLFADCGAKAMFNESTSRRECLPSMLYIEATQSPIAHSCPGKFGCEDARVPQ